MTKMKLQLRCEQNKMLDNFVNKIVFTKKNVEYCLYIEYLAYRKRNEHLFRSII